MPQRKREIPDKLAIDALQMALAHRQPPRGLIHHADRGSQYASHDYQRLLATNGIVSSMSRRADCWDNAVAESFFATLKTELVYQSQWKTRAHLRLPYRRSITIPHAPSYPMRS